jgi:LacI family transcriptional regulator
MTKAEMLAARLDGDIRRGFYPAGSCLPSERDLAATMNLSRVTVRTALAHLEEHGLVERLGGRGTMVRLSGGQRRPTILARTIHFLSGIHREPGGGDNYHSRLTQEMAPILSAHGQSFMVTIIPPEKRVDDIFTEMELGECAGGIIISQPIRLGKAMSMISRAGIPCVALGRLDEAPALPFVETDHRAGAYLAVKHLRDHGRRRIGILVNRMDGFSMPKLQAEGYERAVADLGIANDPALRQDVVGWSARSGYEACGRLLDRCQGRIDALLVCGGEAVTGVGKSLRERGLAMPEDVAVVMYGDYPWLYAQMPMPMTCVVEPIQGLAWNLLDIIDAQCGGSRGQAPTSRILPPELVTRRSCGCAAGSDAWSVGIGAIAAS